MFAKSDSTPFHDVIQGIEKRTLVFGEKTLMTEFRLQKGSTLPGHAHPHEQTGYLVSGRIQLTIGDRTYDVAAGDSWCIPGAVSHSALCLEDAVAVEVFAPLREDYLP
jgi:quercetin dioxygenase-like cupin family protein